MVGQPFLASVVVAFIPRLFAVSDELIPQSAAPRVLHEPRRRRDLLHRTTSKAPPSNARQTTTKAWATTKTTLVLPGTLSVDDSEDLTRSSPKLASEPWRGMYPVNEHDRCTNRFRPPPEAPKHATDYNGIVLPDTCFHGDGVHHVFVIGDWGGVMSKIGEPPVPADRRSKHMPSHHRRFVKGADDVAQQNVAREIRKRSAVAPPDYILNVGDNFYWGGVLVKCGSPANGSAGDPTGQWEAVFENIYDFPGIDGTQWLGVLGNHDYGGFLFTHGWDQAVAYTWAKSKPSRGRWITPAQYYKSKVHYSDFSVDFFFIDSNAWDAHEPDSDPGHNLCSRLHNLQRGASCGVMGPISVDECPQWFSNLWDTQVQWLDNGLNASTTDWQVIVTHFPPEHGLMVWKRLSATYGVDLITTGHRHAQEVHHMEESNFLRPTAYIVSGGGGGITSEGLPTAHGADDQYGFMDLTLTKHEILIEAISHGGHTRSRTCVLQRGRDGKVEGLPGGWQSICEEEPSAPVEHHDCAKGLANWRMVWSLAKQEFCCKYKHICEGIFDPVLAARKEEAQALAKALAPTSAPTPTPTLEPTAEPTPTPTPKPTQEPTPTPTDEPTSEPTSEPQPEPLPTQRPTTPVVIPQITAPTHIRPTPTIPLVTPQITAPTDRSTQPTSVILHHPHYVTRPTSVPTRAPTPRGTLPTNVPTQTPTPVPSAASTTAVPEKATSKYMVWGAWPTTSTTTTFADLFDCLVGYENLEKEWTISKTKWCCKQVRLGCNHLHNCNYTDVHNSLSTWHGEKIEFCCSTFGVGCGATSTIATTVLRATTVEPSKPAAAVFNCVTDYWNWEMTWSVAKQEWCCKYERRGCAHVHDCNYTSADRIYPWSVAKKEWCCMHWNVACPAVLPPSVDDMGFPAEELDLQQPRHSGKHTGATGVLRVGTATRYRGLFYFSGICICLVVGLSAVRRCGRDVHARALKGDFNGGSSSHGTRYSERTATHCRSQTANGSELHYVLTASESPSEDLE